MSQGGLGGATSTGRPGGIGLWQSEGTIQAEPGPGHPCWAGTGGSWAGTGTHRPGPIEGVPVALGSPCTTLPSQSHIPTLGGGRNPWLALEAPVGLWGGGAKHWPHGWDRGTGRGGSKRADHPQSASGSQGVSGAHREFGAGSQQAPGPWPWCPQLLPHPASPSVGQHPKNHRGDPALTSKTVQLSAAKAGGGPREALAHQLPAGLRGEMGSLPSPSPCPAAPTASSCPATRTPRAVTPSPQLGDHACAAASPGKTSGERARTEKRRPRGCLWTG